MLAVSEKSPSVMFGRFLNVPLKVNFDVPLLSVSSPIFLNWIPVKNLERGFFFAEMASGFQSLAISKIKLHLRCLAVL